MAVHVEDHPLSYFDFEGVIPKGEYGGGDVIVWDWGTFEPEETDDPAQGRAPAASSSSGSIGEKLHGRFTLVRTRGDRIRNKTTGCSSISATSPPMPNWDVDAAAALGQERADQRRGGGGRATRCGTRARRRPRPQIDLSAARDAALPEFIEPMKATAADAALR